MDSPAVICAVIGMVSYLFGSVPWAYIIGKINGIDIRRHGSGNVGATNVMRVLGKKWGYLCFLLDFLKGLLPVLAVSFLVSRKIISVSADAAVITAAVAVVAGHIWTIFLKFKGGKGMATGGGVLVAIAPFSFVCCGIAWIIFFYATRYVSVASIVAAALLPVSSYLLSWTKIWPLADSIQIFLLVLTLLAIAKHHSNIRRLMNGTENKFEKKK
ncbi:MAG TPA: acyl-phosphate glycerol 3-phosphate acyltransferase [Lentisphaeria bacterium]|nr:MAG: acyl-phosphate glycerol 3-phosphate acyltransferase [Lentisphaerae bacterium GWF2_49_21]HBC88640.1 acyl-phosphate glycerol 3-phosphate acyltransferase [Lentisphaeria bacterium]